MRNSVWAYDGFIQVCDFSSKCVFPVVFFRMQTTHLKTTVYNDDPNMYQIQVLTELVTFELPAPVHYADVFGECVWQRVNKGHSAICAVSQSYLKKASCNQPPDIIRSFRSLG